MRLVSVGKYYGADQPFVNMFDDVIYTYSREPVKLTKNDVVLFGGGEDIATPMYGQQPSRYCSAAVRSSRDLFEEEVYKEAVAVGAKMLGICRGAQLICALSGGSLVQHITNHGGSKGHTIKTTDGEVMEVSSVHHQMMNPFGLNCEILAWAEEELSTVYIVGGDKQISVPCEPEVVYFPDVKGLGIQFHPEFMYEEERAVKYSRELVSKYLLEG